MLSHVGLQHDQANRRHFDLPRYTYPVSGCVDHPLPLQNSQHTFCRYYSPHHCGDDGNSGHGSHGHAQGRRFADDSHFPMLVYASLFLEVAVGSTDADLRTQGHDSCLVEIS